MFAILAVPLLIFTFGIVEPDQYNHAYESHQEEVTYIQSDKGNEYKDDYSEYE